MRCRFFLPMLMAIAVPNTAFADVRIVRAPNSGRVPAVVLDSAGGHVEARALEVTNDCHAAVARHRDVVGELGDHLLGRRRLDGGAAGWSVSEAQARPRTSAPIRAAVGGVRLQISRKCRR